MRIFFQHLLKQESREADWVFFCLLFFFPKEVLFFGKEKNPKETLKRSAQFLSAPAETGIPRSGSGFLLPPFLFSKRKGGALAKEKGRPKRTQHAPRSSFQHLLKQESRKADWVFFCLLFFFPKEVLFFGKEKNPKETLKRSAQLLSAPAETEAPRSGSGFLLPPFLFSKRKGGEPGTKYVPGSPFY